jgi:hypothetical protein
MLYTEVPHTEMAMGESYAVLRDWMVGSVSHDTCGASLWHRAIAQADGLVVLYLGRPVLHQWGHYICGKSWERKH